MMSLALTLSPGYGQSLSEVLDRLEPELFLPGIVSTGDFEYGSSLSKDEKTFAFVKSIEGFQRSVLVYTQQAENGWEEPQLFPFSGEWHDTNHYFHEPSERFYFTSRRPSGVEGVSGSNLWFVPLDSLFTAQPKLLPGFNDEYSVIYPTVDQDMNVRFCAGRPGGLGGLDLYISTFRNNQYQTPQPLSVFNTTRSDADPELSPDGQLLAYTSQREGGLGHYDLYIAIRQENGDWSQPVNLGPKINSPYMDSDPIFSKDGTRLFFSSRKVIPMGKWPEKNTSYEALQSSLHSPDNGLMNIYVVDIKELKKVLGQK